MWRAEQGPKIPIGAKNDDCMLPALVIEESKLSSLYQRYEGTLPFGVFSMVPECSDLAQTVGTSTTRTAYFVAQSDIDGILS